jgi:hypothetical protein
MGIAARARKLYLARGVGGPNVSGLVWSGADPDFPAIDPEGLPAGARVVRDHTIMRYEVSDCGHISRWRDRLAHGAGDFGCVFAWDGSVIGSVSDGPGRLMSFTWPDGLGFFAPGFEAAPGGGDIADGAAMRRADAERVAAELAEAEASRRKR